MSDSSSDGESTAEPQAKRQRIEEPRPERRFTTGDTAVTKHKGLEKNGTMYRLVVKLEDYSWCQFQKEWKWSYKVTSAIGEYLHLASIESTLIKLDICNGDQVKLGVNGEQVTGIVECVSMDEDDQISYEVRYNALVTKKQDQLTKV